MDLTNISSSYQSALTAATQKTGKSATSASGSAQQTGTSMLGASSTQDAYNMGMEQFITLMIAQLQNQDMLNPTSDTEFVSQMAQFSSLQALSNLEQSMSALQATYTTSYATSLVGQKVVVAEAGADGELKTVEGVVTGVTLFEGQPIIYIGDKGYSLAQIMVVGDAGENNKPDEGGDGDGGNTPDTDPDSETDKKTI